MYDPLAIRRDFGRAAEHYEAYAHLQRRVRLEAISEALDYLPQGSLVADIGCGTGADMQRTGWRYMGIDSAYGMCNKTNAAGLSAICADAARLPLPDNILDGVFSSLMLQWAQPPLPVLREWARVLRPEGYAVVTTLVEGTLRELRQAYEDAGMEAPLNSFTPAGALPALCTHAGFIVLDMSEQTISETYSDALSLLRTLKAIGANDKRFTRGRGLASPRRLKSVQDAYAKAHAVGEFPASWHVVRLVMSVP